MADFPDKVTTETSSPAAGGSQGDRFSGMAASVGSMMDVSFIKSIPAILMICEIVLGLLHWSLIAGAFNGGYVGSAYGWVLFVAITLWILSTILFFIILCGVHQRLSHFVPWTLTVMVYHGVSTVLYFTAFITNAATATVWGIVINHLAAAAFFGALVTVAYGGSTFFSYMAWRGDGGGATTSTAPA